VLVDREASAELEVEKKGMEIKEYKAREAPRPDRACFNFSSSREREKKWETGAPRTSAFGPARWREDGALL